LKNSWVMRGSCQKRKHIPNVEIHWLERPICSYRLDPQFGPLRFYFCESRNASKSRSSAGVWIIPSGMGERSWISRFAMSPFLTGR